MRRRWYLIEAHPGYPSLGIDADETIACFAWTRRGAERVVEWGRRRGFHLRPVRARDWNAEH